MKMNSLAGTTPQEVMERCIANYRKTTGIDLRMAIDPDNFLSNELYVTFCAPCLCVAYCAPIKSSVIMPTMAFRSRNKTKKLSSPYQCFDAVGWATGRASGL